MSEENGSFERKLGPRNRDAQARTEANRERFFELVMKAIRQVPPEFQEKLENLDVIVADWPSPAQMAVSNIRSRYGLLGLYEGVPHTKRGRGYGMVLPDRITIFRKPIESRCRSWTEVEEEIGRVVRHEIAHHFGTGEETLRHIESTQRKKRRWR
ncbi:MAG: metallopeptidase family protein [Dehalococcoidia bacterium]|nr:MAG: metallopeptidase family protein [Dehalococcoidia bacterium]